MTSTTTVLDTPCMEWTGARDKSGYGMVRRGGKVTRIHRATYEERYGPLDSAVVVMHRCDNPPCCAIDHLVAGTHADNHADMITKGRWARREPVTRCPAGHPYDESNTRTWKGHRHCRTCERDNARIRRQQRRLNRQEQPA